MLKRYEIIRPLGRGGRGTVFLCTDRHLPGKMWAIKQASPHSGQPAASFRSRFEHEARILSQLEHPLLPQVADFFEDQGSCWLVMEFLEGDNLQTFVEREGPFGEAEALRLGAILADILEFLHQQSPPLLFRDLKPANCMRTPAGDLKLVDFGLASSVEVRPLQDDPAEGSVCYAAPEVWLPDAPGDARLDIYSWGATMVFLLTGRAPSPHEPERVLLEHAPHLGEAGSAMIRRCLAFDPALRWASVTELKTALREYGSSLGLDLGSRIVPRARRVAMADARLPEMSDPLSFSTAPTIDLPAARKTSATAWNARQGGLTLGLLALVALLGLWGVQGQKSLSTREGVSQGEDRRLGSGGRERHHSTPGTQTRRTGGPDLEQGKRAYAAHHWAEAIEALDVACTAVPNDPEAAILKENAYAQVSHGPVEILPFLGPATGVDASEYHAHLDGLALAQAEINARGGIAGHRLVVELLDDGSSTTQALTLFKQEATQASIRCVLGPTSSQRLLALAPLASQTRLNVVSPTASSERVWNAGGYVFTASDGRSPRVQALARYVVQSGLKQTAVAVDETNRLCRDMAEAFRLEVIRAGGSCLALPPVDGTDSSLEAVCSALQKQPVEVVFCADYRVPPLARLARSLRAHKLKMVLCSQSVPLADELTAQAGGTIEGLLLTDYFHPEVETPRMRTFVQAYQQRFANLVPTYQAANSYDALKAVAQGLEQTHSREELNALLHQTGNERPAFEGVSGRFALGRPLNARPIWLIQLRQGHFELLHPQGGP